MAGDKENETGRYWNRWRLARWGVGALILIVPMVAMQFTDEVKWGVFDFIFAGTLIAVTGIIYELVLKVTGSGSYRAGAAVTLGTVFILIWINGAVGIIGSENNPANLMYFGVLAVVAFGAVIARFEAGGMARVLIGAAALHGVIAVIALVLGHFTLPINAGFAVLWLVAASLFWKADDEAQSKGREKAPVP